jgi:hypothetical protein
MPIPLEFVNTKEYQSYDTLAYSQSQVSKLGYSLLN